MFTHGATRWVLCLGAALGWALAAGGPAWAWAWPADGPILRPFSLGGDPYAAGPAPRRRRRGRSVTCDPRPCVGPPVVRRPGSDPRPDGDDRDERRLQGLSHASRGASYAPGARWSPRVPLSLTPGPSGEAEHDVPYVHIGIRVGDGESLRRPARTALRRGMPPTLRRLRAAPPASSAPPASAPPSAVEQPASRPASAPPAPTPAAEPTSTSPSHTETADVTGAVAAAPQPGRRRRCGLPRPAALCRAATTEGATRRQVRPVAHSCRLFRSREGRCAEGDESRGVSVAPCRGRSSEAASRRQPAGSEAVLRERTRPRRAETTAPQTLPGRSG